ncbi:carbohydrate ABC transporter permease [Halomicrococcus sp. NG-SE-24]|uniref:carbohydrate ABC transporter permease n=1 Tax=Halomicrococcus sp. NG-SE-24 TaxID=3436928 RepID=UPI003D97EF0B
MSTTTRSEAVRQYLENYDRETLVGAGLIVPAVLLIVLALVYPFLSALFISFTDYAAGEIVGLSHYEWLFGTDTFWSALKRSLLWTVGNLALQGIAGIGIALLLHRHFFGRDAVRTVMLIPFVIPSAVTAVMWRWLLNTTYGPLNQWLVQLGLLAQPVNPLADPSLALLTVTLINTWRWAPLVALVVFAVLQTIPNEEYEAARIEGAGMLNEFYHVTYPHLQSSMTVLGLLGFLLTFNIFDIIWLLTNGGPVGRTTTLPVFIYEIAFNTQRIGRGTAISVVLFLLLVVFVALYFQQEEFKEGGEFA